MSTVYNFPSLNNLITRLRDDLNNQDFVLLYAFNGTGKTRTSMAFKDKGKSPDDDDKRDTLYFNAFTEDLFVWDNDLNNDNERFLELKSESNFFNGFKELALDEKIFAYLERYATFDFDIDYDNWKIIFKKQVKNPAYNANNPNNTEPEYIIKDFIKVSRGEENIFIWCIFLAICELAIDAEDGNAYDWVKYIYIDDPISSLDDNNAIAIASDLAKLLKRGKDKIKIIISSHHSLFFNVMCNELKRLSHKRYFLHKNKLEGHTLQTTDETPFFHHVAVLSELKKIKETREINTFHFNSLRSILEKTAVFFGFSDFGKCIQSIEQEDAALYERALNLLSHGKYSIYEPVEMGEDNKNLFIKILDAFLDKYDFDLPELLRE